MRKILLLLLVVITGNIVMCEDTNTNMRKDTIYTVNNTTPLKIHVFLNDNFIYINNSFEVCFINKNTKVHKIITRLENESIDGSSFFILSDLAFIFNGKGTIYIIDSDCHTEMIKLDLNDKESIFAVRSNITPVNKKSIVFNIRNTVFLHNIDKNKMIWEKQVNFLKGRITNRFSVADNILINSDHYHIVAVSLDDGKIIWDVQINEYPGSNINDYPEIINQSLISGDKLLFSTIKFIYCLDVKNGNIIWKKNIIGSQNKKGYMYKNLYITSIPNVTAFNINTGNITWEQDLQLFNSIVYKDYIISDYGFEKKLYFIKMSDGSMFNLFDDSIFVKGIYNFEASKENLYLYKNSTIYGIIIE